jgi:lipoprotein LpqH
VLHDGRQVLGFGTANATKNGNTYHITGNASGVDNAGKEVNKPFTVDVTCP